MTNVADRGIDASDIVAAARPAPAEHMPASPQQTSRGQRLRTTVVRTREQLAELLPAWRAFQERLPTGGCFHNDPDRVRILWDETPDAEMVIVAVFDHDEIVCVAPFSIAQEAQRVTWTFAGRLVRSFSARTLRTIGEGFVFAAGANVAECLTEVFRALRAAATKFDLAYLRDIDMTSPEWQFLRSVALRRLGFRCIRPHVRAEPSHRITLAGGQETYQASLNGNTRRKTRNQCRRLFREVANAKVECATRVDQVSGFLDHLNAVYQTTWQGRAHGAEVPKRNLPAQKARYERFAEHGWLRGYILLAGERPIAYALGSQYAGTFHLDEIGFDPEFGELSPGKVLLANVVEDLFTDSSMTFVNLGWGDFPYKRSLSNQTINATEAYLAPARNFRFRGLARTQYILDGIVQGVLRPVVNRLGVETFVRRMLRRREA